MEEHFAIRVGNCEDVECGRLDDGSDDREAGGGGRRGEENGVD
jgi:hypothetical protein